jgi:transcriptional regulator with XRE-family HTH domain
MIKAPSQNNDDYSPWTVSRQGFILLTGMKINDAFGQMLKQIRESQGITQESLAFTSGLDRTYISLLERGKRQPSLKTLFSICQVLEIKPSEMIAKIERKVGPLPQRTLVEKSLLRAAESRGTRKS